MHMHAWGGTLVCPARPNCLLQFMTVILWLIQWLITAPSEITKYLQEIEHKSHRLLLFLLPLSSSKAAPAPLMPWWWWEVLHSLFVLWLLWSTSVDWPWLPHHQWKLVLGTWSSWWSPNIGEVQGKSFSVSDLPHNGGLHHGRSQQPRRGEGEAVQSTC